MQVPNQMFIDGNWTTGSAIDHLEIIDPATEEKIDSVPSATVTDLNHALTAADQSWKQWREVDEPAFRAKLKELENKWILEGNKSEVEIAQSKLVLLGAKSPILTWAEWKAQFNPDLNSETGASDLSRVFPSSVAPSNALEESSWKSFSLSEVEVKTLVNEAPEELRRRFSANGKASSIKYMSLEFSSATINRAWFNSELFRSRFWKLSDMTNQKTCPYDVVSLLDKNYFMPI